MRKIIVLGLGFGDEDSLSLGNLKLLRSGDFPIWLRTEQHPVVPWLRESGVRFQTFDSIYEQSDNFEIVYNEIKKCLLEEVKQYETIIYAVPGHPMVAEKTVQLLLEESHSQELQVEVYGGSSFLDVAFSRLHLDPIDGFSLLDGTELHPHQINPRLHLLIGQVYSRLLASDVKLELMEVYADDHPITIANSLGIEGQEVIRTVSLYEMDRVDLYDNLTTLYVSPVQEGNAMARRFDFLTQVIEKLRSPEGCPWDRKQTHESLRPYLLEESYEFLEAVTEEDDEAMADELGDVLLQVMLHAQIAKDNGTFDIRDIIGRLSEKMIRRHPHVFGEGKADTVEEVKANWEAIKKTEKEEKKSILDEVPKHLPALLRSYEFQKEAAKVGFDWNSKDEVLAKVHEELNELLEASSPQEQEDELGDLLFVLTSLARHYQVNPELALLGACKKFENRMGFLEEHARKIGESLPLYLKKIEHPF